MKRALALAIICSATWAGDGIEWEPDLATAALRAAEVGRPVLLYFTFDT